MEQFRSAWKQMHKTVRKAQKRAVRTLLAAKEEICDTVDAVKERDPAARSTAEILLLYSGVHAVMAHRLAHSRLSVRQDDLQPVYLDQLSLKHQLFYVHLFCGPTLTSVCDYWKNHCFNYMDFCWQRNTSTF